jgi:flagellar motor component MotA
MRFLGSIVLAVAALFLVKLMSGSWWTALLDLLNFVIVGIIPLLYQLILFGGKNFKNAFSAPLKKECSVTDASKALDFFKTYSKSVWIFSAASTIIGVLVMFKYLSDPRYIGPNMVVALLSFFYAALINLFLILPYISIAKQHLAESSVNTTRCEKLKGNNERFFFSIILVISVFVLITWISGGSLWGLLDAPSFLIVGIIPLFYQLILYGFVEFKNAFSAPLKKDCSVTELSRSLDFFKSFNNSVWSFSMATVGISLIAVFTYLDTRMAMGPNLAVTFLSFLYAALIYLLLVQPYTAIAKQRLSEIDLD